MHYNSQSIKQVEMIRLVHKILDLLPNDEFALEILKASKKIKTPAKKATTRKPRKASPAKKQPKPKNVAPKSENKKINIDPKMATLTFVDILIKQKQYSQASNVLRMVAKNKAIARASIKQREGKIKKELAKEN